MSVATFDNTMKYITLEFDDREIYNDIRSQIDITATTVVTDSPEQYANKDAFDMKEGIVPPSGSTTITLHPSAGDIAETWISQSAEGYHILGVWNPNADPPELAWGNQAGIWHVEVFSLQVTVNSSSSDFIDLTLTNTTSYEIAGVAATAIYRYLSMDAATHEETGTKTLTVRELDETSKKLFGRRVMNLVWPLGQTQEQTVSLAQAYKARLKDPVPRLSMTVQGKTDDLITQIFTRKISDLITVINTDLGLNADCYINAINIYHDPFGLLTAEWTLEIQRTMESVVIFKISTASYNGSAIDGTDCIWY
jgi:hypothetical protein